MSLDLETFIPYRLTVAAAEISRQFSKIYRESHQLSRAEWRIICHLSQMDKGKTMSVCDLEKRAHLDKSKVSRAVSRLQQRGFVEKLRDTSDQRLLVIHLTARGMKVFSEIAPIAMTYNQRLINILGDQTDLFLSQLDRLVENR